MYYGPKSQGQGKTAMKRPRRPKRADGEFVAYMRKGDGRGGGGGSTTVLGKRIVVGAQAIDRMVSGQYEWRDGQLGPKMKRVGQRQTQIYDDGG